MTRRERTELFISDSTGLAKKIVSDIATKSEIKTVHEPQEGLVMIKMRDTARKSQFYLGEVLVTEARVRVDGIAGLGIVQGTNPDLARDLAILDATWNGSHPSLGQWDHEIRISRDRLESKKARKKGEISQTKVNFTSMQEEDYIK